MTLIAPRSVWAGREIEVREVMVMTSVEAAIRARLQPGEFLPTPTGTATFILEQFDPEGLSLLFGPKKTRTTLSWRCLEGIPGYLRGQDWVVVAANRDVGSDRGLDGYLKAWVRRQTANYVAVVLERAGVVALDRQRPARVRLNGQ